MTHDLIASIVLKRDHSRLVSCLIVIGITISAAVSADNGGGRQAEHDVSQA
jgi:hypothetical protein